MGDFKSYNPSGGFDQYLYTQIGDTITASNGVQGKVITEFTMTPAKPFHESLPIYSNTSEVYLKKSDKGTYAIEQARVYHGRKQPWTWIGATHTVASRKGRYTSTNGIAAAMVIGSEVHIHDI